MIYQCYFAPEHRQRLFSQGPYVGFGLEPEVNPTLLRNCPELADAKVRMALAEYGAMLHLWRNPPDDGHSWIGFTSYRQLEKTPVGFQHAADVESLLNGNDILSWYVWDLGAVTYRGLTGLAAHSDALHPGLHGFILEMLGENGVAVPEGYYTQRFVPYANYWALHKPLFSKFMAWSWPIVQSALGRKHPYLDLPSPRGERDNKARAVGYFMERLFILWTQRESLRGAAVGPVFDPTGRPLGSPGGTRQRP